MFPGAVSGWPEPHRARLLIDLLPDFNESDCVVYWMVAAGLANAPCKVSWRRRCQDAWPIVCYAAAEVVGEVTLAELPKKGGCACFELLKRCRCR